MTWTWAALANVMLGVPHNILQQVSLPPALQSFQHPSVWLWCSNEMYHIREAFLPREPFKGTNCSAQGWLILQYHHTFEINPFEQPLASHLRCQEECSATSLCA